MTQIRHDPFQTKTKLDDIVWAIQKLTGPILVVGGLAIGGYGLTANDNVADRAIDLSKWLIGAGLVAQGVNVVGLLSSASGINSKNILDRLSGFENVTAEVDKLRGQIASIQHEQEAEVGHGGVQNHAPAPAPREMPRETGARSIFS